MRHSDDKPVKGWNAALIHPVVYISIALLLLNDHWWKQSDLLPPILTGKLSDFAGLFFFPLLLLSLARGICKLFGFPMPKLTGRVSKAAILITGAIFGAANIFPELALSLTPLWGKIVCDPTDLIALPMLGLTFLWLLSVEKKQISTNTKPDHWVSFAVVFIAGLSSLATSPSIMERAFPKWTLSDPYQELSPTEKLSATAWISQSGKTGIGVSVGVTYFESSSEAVTVSVYATLQLGSHTFEGHSTEKSELMLRPNTKRFLYVAIPFDNEELWNDNIRSGTLSVRISVNSVWGPLVTYDADQMLTTFFEERQEHQNHQEIKGPERVIY